MTATHVTYPFTWRRIGNGLTPEEGDAVGARVTAVLDSWVETPYAAGRCCKAVATDCIRLVAAVLNELYGEERAPLHRLPQDLAMHDPVGARSVLRTFMRAYEPCAEIHGYELEPGDALIVAYGKGGPGHAMIASGKQSSLVHATRYGVVRAGIAFETDATVRVIRVLDKHRWLRAA